MTIRLTCTGNDNYDTWEACFHGASYSWHPYEEKALFLLNQTYKLTILYKFADDERKLPSWEVVHKMIYI